MFYNVEYVLKLNFKLKTRREYMFYFGNTTCNNKTNTITVPHTYVYIYLFVHYIFVENFILFILNVHSYVYLHYTFIILLYETWYNFRWELFKNNKTTGRCMYDVVTYRYICEVVFYGCAFIFLRMLFWER